MDSKKYKEIVLAENPEQVGGSANNFLSTSIRTSSISLSSKR